MNLLLGIGDSFCLGSEAGGRAFSFLQHTADDIGYQCINLGREGAGLAAAAQSLEIAPHDYTQYDKKIIVWCLTSISRLDLWENYMWDINTHLGTPFKTLIPGEQPHSGYWDNRHKIERAMWECDVWNQQSQEMNFVHAYAQVKTWMKANNFDELLMVSSFQETWDEKYFLNTQNHLWTQVNWDNVINVNDIPSIFHWAVSKFQPDYKDVTMMHINRGDYESRGADKWLEKGGHLTRMANKEYAVEFTKALRERINV